jgi:hypothetical protein
VHKSRQLLSGAICLALKSVLDRTVVTGKGHTALSSKKLPDKTERKGIFSRDFEVCFFYNYWIDDIFLNYDFVSNFSCSVLASLPWEHISEDLLRSLGVRTAMGMTMPHYAHCIPACCNLSNNTCPITNSGTLVAGVSNKSTPPSDGEL